MELKCTHIFLCAKISKVKNGFVELPTSLQISGQVLFSIDRWMEWTNNFLRSFDSFGMLEKGPPRNKLQF